MKKSILSIAVAVLGLQAKAQTSDISVTVSPTAQYTWWDKDSGLKDGYFVGGRVGFGFGRNFELRGVYEQSIDLKNSVDNFEDLKDAFSSENVDIKRYGAEFKVNLTNKGLAPYVTIGSGIQEVKVADETTKNIYANAGLGVKLRLTDRIVMNVEGKNTMFNLNPSQTLLDGTNTLEDQRMSNWSVLAGVQFYLAGRRPEQMSDLDKAYYNKYSGGLSGVSISAEPMLAYVDFNDDVNLKDTYMLGGSLGFNFNKYVGLRAYYLQATKDEKIQTKWDKMAMYGGDVIARLNVAKGVVPYLSLGGGYLNQYGANYVGKDEAVKEDNSSYYAKGGLGLTIPISRNVELFGEASLMYTSVNDEPQNTSSPDELKQHTMYNGGIRFNIGKSGVNRSSVDVFEHDDVIVEDEAITREVVEGVEPLEEDTTIRVINETTDDKIRMTPAELEKVIEKAVQEVDAEHANGTVSSDVVIEETVEGTTNTTHTTHKSEFSNAQYLDLKNDIKNLNEKLNRVSNQTIVRAEATGDVIEVEGTPYHREVAEAAEATEAAAEAVEGEVIKDSQTGTNKKVSSLVYYKGLSGFLGANIGDETTANIGIKGHYELSNSKFQLVPDAYVALGKKNGFGLNANVIYPFNYKKGYILNPYVGAGLGVNNLGDKTRFGTNLIVGTSVNVLGGKVYVDYTARNFAKNNQIAVGYKFNY